MKLLPYVLRYDDGAAPNPFWGICTLAIRKPSIRLAAQVDDWIVGLGAVDSPLGDISDSVLCAMKVTSKLTLEDYDQISKTFLPRKLPDWQKREYRMRIGDCVYNYVAGRTPKIRASIHTGENREKDLDGRHALLSEQIYYFVGRPVNLREDFTPLVEAVPGNQSELEGATVDLFIEWIEGLDYRPNRVLGEPQRKAKYLREKEIQAICSARDLEEDQ